ncbi:Os10g0551401, partial [Oryza sativa Japonica Group]
RQSEPARFSTRNPLTCTLLSSDSACDSANVVACTGANPAAANAARHGGGGALSMAEAARWLATTHCSMAGWMRYRSILDAVSGSVPTASMDSRR